MSPAPRPKKKILVAEDDRSLSHALCRMLGAKGYSVVKTGDGTRALEELAREKFDLMLLDIGLPGTSGLDVLEKLRADGLARWLRARADRYQNSRRAADP